MRLLNVAATNSGRRACAGVVVAALFVSGCGSKGAGHGGGSASRGVTETRSKSALSARDTVVRFVRLGQAARFDAACGTLDLRKIDGNDLYGNLRDNAVASLPSYATTVKELRRLRATATNCRGVLALIFAELGPKADQLAESAARARVYWLGPERSDVFVGDEAWTLTRDGKGWRVRTADALVSALPR